MDNSKAKKAKQIREASGYGLSPTDDPLGEFLSALFSDESAEYRYPAEPDPGRKVFVRLRVQKGQDCRVSLLTGDRASVDMYKIRFSTWFDWYEAQFVCPDHFMSYCFLVEWQGRNIIYSKSGAEVMSDGSWIDPRFNFRIRPGFHTPDWAKGALQYQIFVDRFCNGDRSNDVTDGEYYYCGGLVEAVDDWNTPPEDGDFRRFYGGDLQGVLDKLDYISSLGVEAIYFNPIFVSPSSHKYDIQDYDHVDPHFGVIAADVDCPLDAGEQNNTRAGRYIIRTTSPENLSRSDALFAKLCGEIHKRGMKVILDGVFNHCGSFNKWMDREGVYSGLNTADPGAFRSPDSRYRPYFIYKDPGASGYEGWWGHATLPKLNYEGSRELCEKIFDVACRWAQPPYSIDGWRLDVGADLGQSLKFNHEFWKEFRARVKKVNPDLLIVAEHYGDPSAWLSGDEWDSVMNYDAFMEPVTFFLTGMEKHSDSRRDDLYRNGSAFFDNLELNMARFDRASLMCAMNELSNHDHSRFLTRTNRVVGRTRVLGAAAAREGVDLAVFRSAVLVQMTLPGAPTVYYGDEAGQVGWTDPDNRRTYPWGSEDIGLIDLHRALASLRNDCSVLRSGSFLPLGAGDGWIAYSRFGDRGIAVVVCNCGDDDIDLVLRVRNVGADDGDLFSLAIETSDVGFSQNCGFSCVENGSLHLAIPSRHSIVAVRVKG